MGRFLVLVMILGLLVSLTVNHGRGKHTASEAPPIAQPLIGEADFAPRSAGVLTIGAPTSEDKAVGMLSGVGIAPENGCIADYSVTPVTITELRSAVAEAADSNRLSSFRAKGKIQQGSGFRSPGDKRDAELILNRDQRRHRNHLGTGPPPRGAFKAGSWHH